MTDDAPSPALVDGMTPADVLEVLDALERHGVATVVDGGWGVDALVGRQTRPHRDVDLVVSRADLGRMEDALAPLGFRHDAEVRPGAPARHVLRYDRGRQVDGHVVVPDDAGDWRQELDDGSWGTYPAAELRGAGTILGRPVRCIGPALQQRHHQGYDPLAEDLHDLALLAGLTSRAAGGHSS